MADNTQVAGGSGDWVADDELNGTVNGVAQSAPFPKAQRIKPGYGPPHSTQDIDLTHGLPVQPAQPSGAAVTSVAASATSVTLAAANTGRVGLYVFNDGTANLLLKLGGTASATSFTVKIAAGDFYELPAPFYRGVVDGIWDAANGSARVTEVTA